LTEAHAVEIALARVALGAAHVHRAKLGVDPSLFAYAATGEQPPRGLHEPAVVPPEGAELVPLCAESALARVFAACPRPERALACVLERRTVAELRAEADLGPEATDRLVVDAIHRRLLTLHHVHEEGA
jgi:hypothetical protein